MAAFEPVLTRNFAVPDGHTLKVYESRGGYQAARKALTQLDPDKVVNIVKDSELRGRGGAGLSLEQQIAPDLGLFVRAGKADGNTEVYEFTDVDRTLAAGISLQGARWRRSDDMVGLAAINNRISGAREAYLNAGGLGILVGDGKLPHPGPEQIIETYYTAAVANFAHVSLDYQWINHPAYNRDRGPVSVFALRFHAEF